MGFTCPHCQQDLGIDARSVRDAWFFARCFQCGGFAMLKQGEPVREGRKPSVIPSSRKIKNPAPLASPPVEIQPPPFNKSLLLARVSPAIFKETPAQILIETHAQKNEAPLASTFRVPEPLPELKAARSKSPQLIPFLTAVFATLVVALGIRIARLTDRIHTHSAHAVSASSEPASAPAFSLDHLAHFEGESTEDLQALIRAQTVQKSAAAAPAAKAHLAY